MNSAAMADLVRKLLRDFPEMRFGYHASGSAEADLRHLVRHMASITTELAAKEPQNVGIAMAFEWAEALRRDDATRALGESFYTYLSPLALTMQPAR
jgi:hypothetical protein